MFFSQLADLRRQTASVNLKKICKFLPVIGNGKAATMLLRLYQQIGHQFFSCGTPGYDFNFLIQKHIFCGDFFHQIKNHSAMKFANVAAWM